MSDSNSSTQLTMSKGTKTKTQKRKTKRLMVEGGMKQAATEVDGKEENEPAEGFLNAGNGDESEKPQSELKESDYEKEERSVEEDDKGGEKGGEESVD